MLTIIITTISSPLISLKWPNEFKIFHKMKFKDLTNQRRPQRILAVWELCPTVVGSWLTAGKDLKYFSSCLLSIVLFLQRTSMRHDPPRMLVSLL